MKVLVACEFSGVVRRAFASLGHDAWSCDLLPPEDASPNHFKCDVLGVIGLGWDIMIAHPPCTYLCSSGMHWTVRGKRDPKLTEEALEFVMALMNAPIQRICIENPQGAIGTRIRPADQWIQPWEFGDDASKKTGLWLKGLPPLRKDHSRFVPGRVVGADRRGRPITRWGNQTDSGQNKLGPSDTRWAERSKTYPGIAMAMAEQWGA